MIQTYHDSSFSSVISKCLQICPNANSLNAGKYLTLGMRNWKQKQPHVWLLLKGMRTSPSVYTLKPFTVKIRRVFNLETMNDEKELSSVKPPVCKH